MATIALSAAGMALGGSIGGSVLGLSMATLGRAAGAALGQRIDQRLLGSGSAAVETGRIDRFRLTAGAEGADMLRVYGRMRVAGQVIWASDFLEDRTTSGSGKGSRPTPEVTVYQYSVSLALALCEGQIARIGRIWADGNEISPEVLNMRVYTGSDTQLADPKISAVEGAENTPAYRGTAYVVLEDLTLGQFGNRIPQLTFEVFRSASDELWQDLRGVTVGDGQGAFAYATSQLTALDETGARFALNTHSPLGGSDFSAAIDAMEGDLPQAEAICLPVAWFGDDLRCAECTLTPLPDSRIGDPAEASWRVSGLSRSQIGSMSHISRGTPSDAAFVEAVQDLTARGKSVLVKPRIIMTQQTGNGLPDPWSDGEQAAAPWVGRLTVSLAARRAGSLDGTAAARTEIEGFFGDAQPADFNVAGHIVDYGGPAVGGYRRMVLHYAHLAAAAGGVAAFLIGDDLAGLTLVRDEAGAFPAVEALRALAADVRTILGAQCQVGYAADTSEAMGYTPTGTQDRLFPLDALWAAPDVDFVGINARFPLSDWRYDEAHLDAAFGDPHNLAYLQGNVAGGEGYDWRYPTPEARAAQRRVPITDADGEPWVWRQKDMEGWWSYPHHERVGGARAAVPTAWVPQSKPIWLTRIGCQPVDLGANLPDPKVQGRTLPEGAMGRRDDMMQVQYMRAVLGHYGQSEANPISPLYQGSMVDLDRCFAEHWDVRPFPFFPNTASVWSDWAEYPLSTALNGRASSRRLASVVAEICARSGVRNYDVSALYGVVRGYMQAGVETGRAALQPLMLAFDFDAYERAGVLVFQHRLTKPIADIAADQVARDPESDEAVRYARAPKTELAGRVQVGFLDADGDYAPAACEARLPDDPVSTLNRSEFPLALTNAEATECVGKWLKQARVARDTVQFGLPPSQFALGAGDVVSIDDAAFRIARVEEGGVRMCEAARVAKDGTVPVVTAQEATRPTRFTVALPVDLMFLDLPLLTGDEVPHAPHVAVSGNPWSGSVALYSAPQDSDYTVAGLYEQPANVGALETALDAGPVGLVHRRSVRVALSGGALQSVSKEALLSGANTIAIGTGAPDGWEVIQFQTATPVQGGYILSGLYRGLRGTSKAIPASWPVGSPVVVLDGSLSQLDLPSAARGTDRHFRYGPASRPLGDASYQYRVDQFAGIGFRPYPVVHLHGHRIGGDLEVNWIRSTRIDGDLWEGLDVPLGEDSELYILRVLQGGATLREVTVTQPGWTYSAAAMAADLSPGLYSIAVAQVSARFGPGPFHHLDLTR